LKSQPVPVYGEHLGLGEPAINLLLKLRLGPFLVHHSDPDCDRAIQRTIAGFELLTGNESNFNLLSLSDKIQSLLLATLSSQVQLEVNRSGLFYQKTLLLALDLATNDPVNRTLAITSNNLACALEDKAMQSELTEHEKDLMLSAAMTARKYWEIAGSFLEIERAEYRLAQSYRKLGDYQKSFVHASKCLEIVLHHQLPDLEIFFAYEVLALVEKAQKNTRSFEMLKLKIQEVFDRLEKTDQEWCQKTILNLLE
jgi:tetratricopeptide (TPR) repeat protein